MLEHDDWNVSLETVKGACEIDGTAIEVAELQSFASVHRGADEANGGKANETAPSMLGSNTRERERERVRE
jgi:hypothetical protein